jgi:hypothetical protein
MDEEPPLPPTTVIDQTPTAHMEVHHHPDLHHKPKKWKEYFLEFFMIFLAVTMGFIAENIREHFTDRAKERQYISGIISNLKDDTANLRGVIEFDRQLIKGIDSMLILSHVNMSIDSNRRSFYYFALHYCYNTVSFKSNDATIQQLKNTGDYRLIEKDHIADSLTKYEAGIQGIYSQGAYYNNYFKEILSRLDELTDMSIILDSSFIKNGKMTNKSFPVLRDENGKLRTFFNKIFDFVRITQSYADDFLVPQLENSKNLIEFLKKEYSIGD